MAERVRYSKRCGKFVEEHEKESVVYMKNKIIATSIELFEKQGFTETSIQHIVDALDVTKGTFYYYFQSKEQLLMDIHTQYIDDLLHRQQQVITEYETAKDQLTAMLHLLIQDIEIQGARARVFLREMRHLMDTNSFEVKEKRDEFRLVIEEVIRQGIEAGELLESLDPAITAFAFLSLTNYSYNWFNPHGALTAAQLSDAYSDIFFKGIAKEG